MADNQHNDPLEEFFRKKVRNYDIEYNEADWEKLEKRLDAADEKRSNRQMRYLAAAAIIFLFSILAYVTYQQQVKINQLNERLTNNQQTERPLDLFSDLLPQNLFDLSVPVDNQGATPTDETNAETIPQENMVTSDDLEAKESENNNETGDLESAIVWNTASVISPATLSDPQLLTATDTVNASIDREILVSAGQESSNSGYTPIDNIEEADERAPLTNTQSSFTASTKDSKWTLGILAGPDLSTVGGLSNFYDPGYKIGLTVEYSLTDHLALSVGAVHSKVQYSASGNEYNPPQNYWSYGIVPHETVGRCLLIDIPINLKYDFLHLDHSRLFASAGMSSYIMLNEDYQFTYEYSSSDLQQRWKENTGTRHWMSNATFSLGYEMDLNQKLSLRAEPFIKVPIQEVGWGNVKLYSMGSLISVNYNL